MDVMPRVMHLIQQQLRVSAVKRGVEAMRINGSMWITQGPALQLQVFLRILRLQLILWGRFLLHSQAAM
jgi:hypothetical protein